MILCRWPVGYGGAVRASGRQTARLVFGTTAAPRPCPTGACEHAATSSFVSHTSVDCTDAYALSRWWQAVLDYVEDAADPNEPGHEECLISSRDGHHDLLFIEVPDAKRVKN